MTPVGGKWMAGVGGLLDKAVTIPSARVHAYVDSVRRRKDTPARLIQRLERKYLRRVAAAGGAIGTVAAVPAIGTMTAVSLTGTQLAEFLYDSTRHIMAVADVHGVAVDDVDRRRTLLLASLLGEEGAAAVQTQLGVGTLYWGRALLTRLPLTTVRSVNLALRGRVLRAGAAMEGRMLLGRYAPFGIGAVIGWLGARAMGRQVLKGVRATFGPPPAAFSRDIGQVSMLSSVRVTGT